MAGEAGESGCPVSTGECKQTCWAPPKWARVGREEALGYTLSPGNIAPPWLCLLKPKFGVPSHPGGSLAEFGSKHSFGRDTSFQL